MKKLLLYLLVIIPFSLSAFSMSNVFNSNNNVESKKVNSQNSIAIGKFQLKGNTSQNQYSDYLSEFRNYVDDSFSKNSNFIVINKSRSKEIMLTNGLSEKTNIDFKNIKLTKEKIAKYKEFNADYVLLGDIRNFSLDKLRGSKINNGEVSTISKKQLIVNSYLSVALINVASQEVVAKESLKIKKVLDDENNSATVITNALSIMADELVSSLLLSMSNEIKVISIKDEEIVLNKGTYNGIKVGMNFDLYNKKKIETYETQEKVASIKITRVDKEISFASLKKIIKIPKRGNIAKYIKDTKKEFTDEKIRIAIGETVIEKSNIKNNAIIKYINRDMEYAFSQNRSFVVTDNNKSQTNKILAQQILDELSKGRETGLPLGSLRGVDYLVFNTIDYLKFNNKRIKIEHLKSLDITTVKEKNAKAQLSGYVYLIDVNTGNKVASVPVNISHEFSLKENTFEIMMKELSSKFTTTSSKAIFNKISPLRVVRIEGMNILLNGGKKEGIKKGEIFTVFSKGQMLQDNRTGQSYESGGMPIAKVKVESFTNRDEAVAILISGNITQTGLEVKLDIQKNKIGTNNIYENEEKIAKRDRNKKKYVIIKKLLIDKTISRYKHKYLNESKIDTKIEESINKSKMFRTLSRDKDQIRQLMQEKQIAQSDISDDIGNDKFKLSLAEYILIPKVTKFKLSKSSSKIEYINSYENREYIELELKITLMNTKGEILFDDLSTEKYSRSWASDKKNKSSIPSRSNIYKLAEKVVKKSINNVINNKIDILSDGFITVVEVGKFALSLDLAEKKDINIGDTFYVYPEPKIKKIVRTGKKRLTYGSRVAEVKIDAIFDDGAEAIVSRGDIKDIKENFILRKKHQN